MISLQADDLQCEIKRTIKQKDKALVLNVNAHALNLAYEQPWLCEFFNQAAIVFPDGYGAVWAGRLLGSAMQPRITYADWFYNLAAFAAINDFSLFFLGARPGVAEAAQQKLLELYKDLRIVGVHHGYFDKTANSEANQALLDQINRLAPDILVVAFGMPMQERWLKDNWDKVEAHVALTGGAVFDYVSGKLKRPPRWLANNGFEWLGRLIIEPGRLWQRYLLGNPKFVWRVFRERLFGSKKIHT